MTPSSSGPAVVGMPAAMHLAEKGMKVLCLDQFASPGQGSNKCAIGGIRATHSSPAKIKLCLDSLKTFSTWKEEHGWDLEWAQGGYTFVAYRAEEERLLKNLLVVQKQAGLNIDWLDRAELLKVAPGLRTEGLLGGTFSPEDGSASPMRSCLGFHRRAVELGVECRFNERVTSIMRRKGKVVGVRTDQGGYATACVINAAGAWARAVANAGGLDAQVVPDSHEAGITEAVAPFLDPMVVDVRPAPGSLELLLLPAQARPGGLLHLPQPAHRRLRPPGDQRLPAHDRAADGGPHAQAGQPEGPPHLARPLPHDPRRRAAGGAFRPPGRLSRRHRHVRPGLHARPRRGRPGGEAGHGPAAGR